MEKKLELSLIFYWLGLEMPLNLVKVFLWKACHDRLPLDGIWSGGKSLDSNCPFYLEPKESTLYDVWSCPKLNKDFFFNCLALYPKKVVEELVVILWRTRHRCNLAINSNKSLKEEGITL
ncbi:conserved hypothetical protein [Ricinus communis]|uniref:Reverse transcriptase zinc-binding domain-containing protein n=1 Tax=Ricinus communis TaxID=3988 RepID=B9S7F5_RICCO|nr:conserved hypothetical protein [Ricinus communis]